MKLIPLTDLVDAPCINRMCHAYGYYLGNMSTIDAVVLLQALAVYLGEWYRYRDDALSFSEILSDMNFVMGFPMDKILREIDKQLTPEQVAKLISGVANLVSEELS